MKKKNNKPKSDGDQADARKTTKPGKEKVDKEDSSPKAKSSKSDKTPKPAKKEKPPVETSQPGDGEKTPAKKEEPVSEIAKADSIGQEQTYGGETEAGLKPEEFQAPEPSKAESKPATDAQAKAPVEQRKSAFRFVGLFLFLFIVGGAVAIFNRGHRKPVCRFQWIGFKHLRRLSQAQDHLRSRRTGTGGDDTLRR